MGLMPFRWGRGAGPRAHHGGAAASATRVEERPDFEPRLGGAACNIETSHEILTLAASLLFSLSR